MLFSGIQIYRPDLFDAEYFIYLGKIIPLLINSSFVVLVFMFFYKQKKNSQYNLGDFQIGQLEQAIIANNSLLAYSGIAEPLMNKYVKEHNGKNLCFKPSQTLILN